MILSDNIVILQEEIGSHCCHSDEKYSPHCILGHADCRAMLCQDLEALIQTQFLGIFRHFVNSEIHLCLEICVFGNLFNLDQKLFYEHLISHFCKHALKIIIFN